MNFLQRTPFFRLLLPLTCGIVFYQYAHLYTWCLLALFLLSATLIISPFLIRKPDLQFRLRWINGSGIFIFLFVTGYFTSARFDKENIFDNLEKPGVFSIELTENPIEKARSYFCQVKVLHYFDAGKAIPSGGNAVIYIQKDSAASLLKSGDRLLVQTTFHKPDGAINPGGFNYALYLKHHGVRATSYIGSDRWQKTGVNTGFSIFRLAEKYQHRLMEVYKRFGIDGDEFAVLAALTLGFQDKLHPELRDNYTASGGMHILAVSGSHVAIIYFVFGFLLAFMNKTPKLKILKTIVIIFLLWMYALITGLSPSVIRATLMFSLISFGSIFERKGEIYNTICFSAFIILLFRPNILFDVGFQLSYGAVISIIYFQPAISKWFSVKNKILRWTWDLVAVSLAAQIGTAPFGLFYFHQYANYFLITNIVGIPASFLIIYTTLALLVFSSVPYLSSLLAFILSYLLKGLNYSIYFIHNLPFSISQFSIDIWQVSLIVCIIIMLTAFYNSRKFIYLSSSLCCALIIILINLKINYQTYKNTGIVVYADNKNTHVDFIEGKNHYLYSTDLKSAKRAAGSYWLNNKLYTPLDIQHQSWFRNGFAEFSGQKICLLTNQNLIDKTTYKPLKVDYLIIGNGIKPRINQILECITPRKIIVDKSISAWYTKQIRNTCHKRNINFYSVAEHGAFILKMKD